MQRRRCEYQCLDGSRGLGGRLPKILAGLRRRRSRGAGLEARHLAQRVHPPVGVAGPAADRWSWRRKFRACAFGITGKSSQRMRHQGQHQFEGRAHLPCAGRPVLRKHSDRYRARRAVVLLGGRGASSRMAAAEVIGSRALSAGPEDAQCLVLGATMCRICGAPYGPGEAGSMSTRTQSWQRKAGRSKREDRADEGGIRYWRLPGNPPGASTGPPPLRNEAALVLASKTQSGIG